MADEKFLEPIKPYISSYEISHEKCAYIEGRVDLI